MEQNEPQPYRIVAAARTRKDIARLPDAVAAAVFEFVENVLSYEPHRVGGPLLAPFQGMYAARRGTYRIVYRINEPTRTLEIARIGNRSEVYRP